MSRLALLGVLLVAGCTGGGGATTASDASPSALPGGVTVVAAVTVERIAPFTEMIASPPPPDAPVLVRARVDETFRTAGAALGDVVSFLAPGGTVAAGDRMVVFLVPREGRVAWRSAPDAPPLPYSDALGAALRSAR